MKACEEIYGKGEVRLRIATGSPGELGLLEAWIKEWDPHFGVCWIKSGSGESLERLKKEEIEVALVHAPMLEKIALQEKWASRRELIASNAFYLLGPFDDPAGVRETDSIVEAYKRIAQKQCLFYTRADQSGTHKRELEIWEKAKITPCGSWYVCHKDFMLATLRKADATQGYFMSDSSTYKLYKKELRHLEVLLSGDPLLVNLYVAMLGKSPSKEAEDFLAFLLSKKGQRVVSEYGENQCGERLYENRAASEKFFIQRSEI